MTDPLTYLSLFSGIGGLDLGLDRAGWTCVGQVEIDPYCRSVLARHWPEVPRHDDVRTAPAWWRSGADRPAVRLVAGGPPCQPASSAGRRLGQGDPRWGWPWFLDVVRAIRPDYAVMENPAALLSLDRGRPFGWILAELAALGFDAEWTVLSACALGAPHTRERLFVLAHPPGVRFDLGAPPRPDPDAVRKAADPWWHRSEVERTPWATEPDVGRVAHGLPGRVDRVRAIGNAVVPAVGEFVGRLITAVAR